MRLDLIATILFSLSGLVIAGLQANQHFLLPAMAPSMYDLGMLFGVIILAPQTGYHIGPLNPASLWDGDIWSRLRRHHRGLHVPVDPAAGVGDVQVPLDPRH